VDSTGELAQLVDCGEELGDGVVDALGEGCVRVDVVGGFPGLLQGQSHGDKPLLRSVVQVADDVSPLVLGGLDEPRP
jgi:hypothetical protein